MKIRGIACWLGVLSVGTVVAAGQAGMPVLPKQVSAKPPVTSCALQSKDQIGVLGLVYNSPTGTIAYWTDFTITCGYTGSVQTLTLPPGTDHDPLGVTATGAGGGKITFGPNAPDHSYDYSLGGKGAQVSTTLNLAPGTVLQMRVGGAGQDGAQVIGGNPMGVGGWNGGGSGGQRGGAGGGGASDVRVAPFADANRLVAAGGGGGAGMYYYQFGVNKSAAGGAGGQNGGDGFPGMLDADYQDTTHTAGYGATQGAAGAGSVKDPYYSPSYPGAAGSGSAGGAASVYGNGGGGGGGWFGGGAGDGTTSAGGGGGSSNIVNGSNTQYASGAQDGNGQMVLRYRVYTYRVTCLNRSVKSIARGQTEPVCEQVSGP